MLLLRADMRLRGVELFLLYVSLNRPGPAPASASAIFIVADSSVRTELGISAEIHDG